jgi:DMSO/TMAO reductase YedYZ molybdopterin-dependent catalytic subunit
VHGLRIVGMKVTRIFGPLIGLIAASAALGVAELVAGSLGRAGASPILAVGAAGIDRTPEWLKDFAIRHFGTDDKLVLLLSLGAGVAVLAIVVGIVARRHLILGCIGLAAFGVVGMLAALTRPTAVPTDALPSVIGTVAGLAVLVALLRAASRTVAAPADGPGPDRRGLLLTGAGSVALAGVSGTLGRALINTDNVNGARKAVQLPRPSQPAPAIPAGAQVRVPGMTSFTTSNGDFYRVDDALTLPQVSPADWKLRVHGMVDHPMEISFDDLLHRPLIEHDITLTCVSNEVGGPYVGTARWLGASISALLREAGVHSGADQILSRSADGWTASTPIEVIMDGREALLAVAMNGDALPVKHGFPARMVVPGLYGYVSATKWVVDLKVTQFATDKAYWTKRGYAETAPIKTESRIDVPKPFQQVKAGRVPVAGVAWAQHRGIDAVEVRVDGGAWKEAQLAPVPGIDTWRQWYLEWDATPGSHSLEVRATDATGATQPEHRVPVFPNGATGWHSVVVTAT